MSRDLSDISPLDLRKEKRISWLDTYYIENPNKNLSVKKNFSVKSAKLKQRSVDMSLQFEFQRISEWQFKFICHRTLPDDSIPAGEYKLQFHCDISVFDEEIKVFEMLSNEFKAEENFLLNESNHQNIFEGDLEKMFALKILITMIEFDTVSTEEIINQMNLFRDENKDIYNNDTTLKNMFSILKVLSPEDALKGQHNLKYIIGKRKYIQRTAIFSKTISEYLSVANASIMPPDNDFELILNYIFKKKNTKISDEDLIKVYYEAHTMGLAFLIILSRDCLLYRLKYYENCRKIPEYENLIFEVLKASAHVNDEKLFEKSAGLLNNQCKTTINSDDKLLERLGKLAIRSRFVICYLRRLKKQKPGVSCFGRNGADAATRHVETL